MTDHQGTRAGRNAMAEACRDLANTAGAGRNHSPEKEDVKQEAFARALSAANASAVRDPVRYFFRIARNLFIDGQRRKLREFAAYEVIRHSGQARADALNPERILLAKQELQRVTAAIECLPPRCRQAFVLHRFEQMSYSSIARQMGVSAGTVEKHIAEAMLKIARAIREPDEDMR